MTNNGRILFKFINLEVYRTSLSFRDLKHGLEQVKTAIQAVKQAGVNRRQGTRSYRLCISRR
uniref:Uncharacterized protein n=1 Tax=Citrobacter freundii TaxID=546 RepID=A0A3S5I465_CITFR|nr:hypothetical protein [Citrobacter freundii]